MKESLPHGLHFLGVSCYSSTFSTAMAAPVPKQTHLQLIIYHNYTLQRTVANGSVLLVELSVVVLGFTLCCGFVDLGTNLPVFDPLFLLTLSPGLPQIKLFSHSFPHTYQGCCRCGFHKVCLLTSCPSQEMQKSLWVSASSVGPQLQEDPKEL